MITKLRSAAKTIEEKMSLLVKCIAVAFSSIL